MTLILTFLQMKFKNVWIFSKNIIVAKKCRFYWKGDKFENKCKKIAVRVEKEVIANNMKICICEFWLELRHSAIWVR